ncbi:MAG: hypothetical protein KF873_01980 [Gemmataceae bacterium]|nr:hypothetical protein [Gemmataceae bacterium]
MGHRIAGATGVEIDRHSLRSLFQRAAGRWDFEAGVLASTLAAGFGGEPLPNPFAPPPPPPTDAQIASEDRRAWAAVDAFFAQSR